MFDTWSSGQGSKTLRGRKRSSICCCLQATPARNPRRLGSFLDHSRGPSTQYLRFLAPKTILLVVLGTRNLRRWACGPIGLECLIPFSRCGGKPEKTPGYYCIWLGYPAAGPKSVPAQILYLPHVSAIL